MGVEKGELMLHELKGLIPRYCTHLGALAVASMGKNSSWTTEYNENLQAIGAEIKWSAQGERDIKSVYLTPNQVLEKFLKGMFGEAVSNRYKFEKGKFDAKRDYS